MKWLNQLATGWEYLIAALTLLLSVIGSAHALLHKLERCGPVIARGIADGPDEDFEKLRWTILAALAAAQKSVRIATPYFLPEPTIIAALNLAAMRSVVVDILLPARSNLPFVQWASTAQWWQMLKRGCRIWLSPPPFDHSNICR